VPEVEELVGAVAAASLGPGGAVPASARRHARMVEAFELLFWNTLAEGVS
jgi:hypothetical protein